jgi:hypothetical protein
VVRASVEVTKRIRVKLKGQLIPWDFTVRQPWLVGHKRGVVHGWMQESSIEARTSKTHTTPTEIVDSGESLCRASCTNEILVNRGWLRSSVAYVRHERSSRVARVNIVDRHGRLEPSNVGRALVRAVVLTRFRVVSRIQPRIEAGHARLFVEFFYIDHNATVNISHQGVIVDMSSGQAHAGGTCHTG